MNTNFKAFAFYTALALITCLTGQRALAQSYQLSVLPVPDPENDAAYGKGINERGQVTGSLFHMNPSPGFNPVIYEPSGSYRLFCTTLSDGEGEQISDSGIVYGNYPLGSFVWDGSSCYAPPPFQPFAAVDPNHPALTMSAYASSMNRSAVFAGCSNSLHCLPTVWHLTPQGSEIPLTQLLGSYFDIWEKEEMSLDDQAQLMHREVWAEPSPVISDNGTVAGVFCGNSQWKRKPSDGYNETSNTSCGIFLSSGGSASVLTRLPNAHDHSIVFDYVPDAVNDNGTVVGHHWVEDYDSLVWVASSSGLSYLPGYDTESAHGFPEQINNRGIIVGNISTAADSYMPVIWSGGKAYDLNSFLPATSPWDIWKVSAVNNCGRGQITGEIHHKVTSMPRAFVLTPSDCGNQVQDLCPDDPEKLAPGQCGCGTPDTDSDGDGTADCLDQCPNDPQKIEPGVCNCGNSEKDSDGDKAPDCVDLCPNDPFKTEPGNCGCGVFETRDSVLSCLMIPPAKIGDRVWNDINHNGIQDPGEPGIGGVSISVKESQGRHWAKTETAGDGSYFFNVIPGASYGIGVGSSKDVAEGGPLFNMKVTLKGQGNSRLLDSNADSSVYGAAMGVVAPGPAQIDYSIDCGFYQKSALPTDSNWKNPRNQYDVNNDGMVAPDDVMIEIDRLNSEEPTRLPPLPDGGSPHYYYDVTGDGLVTPLDALSIINYINQQSTAAAASPQNDATYRFFQGLMPAGGQLLGVVLAGGSSQSRNYKVGTFSDKNGNGEFLVKRNNDGSTNIIEAPAYGWTASNYPQEKVFRSFSSELNTYVVNLRTSPTNASYTFKDNAPYPLKTILRWNMKASPTTKVSLTLETTAGQLTLNYLADNGNLMQGTNTIFLGQPGSTTSWFSLVRNVQQDLNAVKPGAFLTRIVSFQISNGIELTGLELAQEQLPEGTVVYDADEPGALNRLPAEKLVASELSLAFLQERTGVIMAKELIPVKAGVSYQLSGLFKQGAAVTLGLASFDENGKAITSSEVMRRGSALTVSGLSGKTIRVKEKIKDWNSPASAGSLKLIAFYYNGDTSKRPDYVFKLPVSGGKTTKQGAYKSFGAKSIALNASLPKAVAKKIIIGKTKMMNHYEGSDYTAYSTAALSIPGWQEVKSPLIQGEGFGDTPNTFRAGTRYVKIEIAVNKSESSATPSTVFDRISFGPAK